MSIEEKTEREKEIEPRLGDDIPDNWIIQAQKEISSKYRTIVLDKFRDKEKVKINIYHPTPGEEAESSDAYMRVFNKLIRDPEILTYKEMEKILKDRKIWGEEQENQIEDLKEDMKSIELTVAHLRKKGEVNKSILDKYKAQWRDKQEKINAIVSNKNKYLINTVENKAEEEQTKVKLSLCVRFAENNERVWKSLEDFNKEEDQYAISYITQHALFFWVGLTQEIIDELPTKLLFGGE